jgi:hypothetical protein
MNLLLIIRNPKKWWNFDVIKLLLQLHLGAAINFGPGQQGDPFIENKKYKNNQSLKWVK